MSIHIQTIKKATLNLLFAGVVMLVSGKLQLNAQALTGTKTIPGSYPTIASAITDLNANGVGTGGVFFDVAADYTETITATLSLTATGTAANPIIFRKSGAGANPLITAYVGTSTPGSAAQDGIWRLVGSDYVTIDGIDLYDPNTTNPATMEYGYAFYKADAANGAQYNTIKNCVISLSRENNASGAGPAVDGSRGIEVVNATFNSATTNLTPVDRAGTNSYNSFLGNTVKNCNTGIVLIGFAAASPFTAADTLNNVGGNSLATGNTILNFGGASGAANPAAGVRTLAQYGLNVANNIINSNDGSGADHANTISGIYINTAVSASVNINNNTVSVKCIAGSGSTYGIENAAGSTAANNTINISGNIVENCTHTASGQGELTGIFSNSSPATLNIKKNIVRNNSVLGSYFETLYGIQWIEATNIYVDSNTIYGLSMPGTILVGTTYGLVNASTTSAANEYVTNNTIHDLTNSSASPYGVTIRGIYQQGGPGIKEYKNNTVYNLSISGAGMQNVLDGIQVNQGQTIDISGNSVYALSGNIHTMGGIGYATGTENADYRVYKNKIYNLASGINGATLISGIRTDASTTTIYNNLIADLRAPAADGEEVIRGINITSTTASTINAVYYNTIYLNASSTGTNFGTTGIYHTTSNTATTAALDMRNNIIVNTSTPAGTGIVAAYRRPTIELNNYSNSSNNNLFYAGTPTANRLLFYDGTNMDSTLTLLKTRLATRDQASITENPVWLSTTGSAPDFLNINTATATQIESKGTHIATFADDFNGNVRFGNSGYPVQTNGGGVAPDMGAWEFDGIPLLPPSLSNISITPGVQCVATAHTVTVNAVANSGTLSSVVLDYSFNGVAQTPLNMTNTSGNTYEATIPMASPVNAAVTWSITASNSISLSVTSTSLYADEPLSGAVTAIRASSNPICSGAPTQLSAVLAKTEQLAPVGAGATTGQRHGNPFYGATGNTHNQHLIRADELIAAGLFAGNITSLAIEITAGTTALTDLSIKMAHTNATDMRAFVSPAFTNVYNAASYTPVVGVNTMVFSAPFNWDGTSNVVIEICHGNGASAATIASTAKVDNQSYISTIHTDAGAATAGSAICSDVTSNLATFDYRPRFIFRGVATFSAVGNYAWSDGTNTVATTNPAVVTPATNTNYTFTLTDVNGCGVSHITPYQLTVNANTYSATYNVGVNQSYTTLTAAIDAYNNSCLGGPVTFLLTDTLYSTAETFPLRINGHPQASATNTLTIKPAAGINVAIRGNSSYSVLNLNASKYVTIDGSNNGTNSRNLTIQNTLANNTTGVVWGQNSVAGDSAMHNTISNVIIQGSGSGGQTTFVGIGFGNVGNRGITTGFTLNFGQNNNNNVVRNCKISRVQYGIYSGGTSVAIKNQNTLIENNELNSAWPDHIVRNGIFMCFENNAVIRNNRVGNITNGGAAFGINLGITSFSGYAPTGNEVTNALVERNTVGPVTAGDALVHGIAVAPVTSGTNRLINNAVFGMVSAARNDNLSAGVYIGGGSGSSTKLFFNSVSLTGASSRTTPSSYALAIGGTDPSVELKNNILYNTQTATGAANNYAIGYASAAFSNLVSNNNLYYTAGSNGKLAVTGELGDNTVGTVLTTLAALQTVTSQDANSINTDPLFSRTDSLVPDLRATGIVGAGTAIPGVTTDIAGVVRNNPPSIGVYENLADLDAPAITYSALTNHLSARAPSRVLNAFASITDSSGVNVNNGVKPRIYYKKKADNNVFAGNTSGDNGWKWTEATNSSSPFDFNIDYNLLFGGLINHLDTIQYFVVAQDNATTPNTGANPAAGFSATSVANILIAPTTPNQYTEVNLAALNGAYTIGISQTTADYQTLTAAVADLKLRGVSGPVLFNLIDNLYGPSETLPVVLPEFSGASSVNTVTLKPAAGVTSTLSGSNANAILKFANKAQYYIIDGSNNGSESRDLMIHNTFVGNPTPIALDPVSSVVWMEGLDAAEGVKHAVLKNTLIKGGSNLSGMGVLVGGAIINTYNSGGAGTDSVLIANNNVYNCHDAIVIRGSAANRKVSNIEVYKNDIGSDTFALVNHRFGVYAAFANRINVHHNHIYNVKTNEFEDNAGIQVEQYTTNSTFSGNRIHGIYANYSTSGSGMGAYGINIGDDAGVDNDSIYNNAIYDIITSNYSTTNNLRNAFGIRLVGGSNLKIYYNSVNLYGMPIGGTNASASAAFFMLGNSYPGIDIRNNTFTNSMAGIAAGSKHAAYWTTLTAPLSSAVFDKNNFYASGPHGILMNNNGADVTTLTGLKTAAGANINSINVDPGFGRNDSLIPTLGTAIIGGGVSIPGISTDILGIARSANPTIGAYETGADLRGPDIAYTSLANHLNNQGTRQLLSFATISDYSGVDVNHGTKPRIYYKKSTDANVFAGNGPADNGWKWAEATNSTSPFDFTMDYGLLTGGVAAHRDTIQYFVTAQENTTAAFSNANPAEGFMAASVAAITSAPYFPSQYVVGSMPPLSGVYYVGALHTSPNYASITSALSDLALRGLGGPVTFALSDTVYSSGETFPIVISEYMGASAVNTLTIKPDVGVDVIIRDSSATAVINLNGADYVTIDGSNNGSSSRNLTIVNRSVSTSSAVIWAHNTSSGDSVTHNTISNVIISGDNSSTTLFGIGFGGTNIGNARLGHNNNSNTIKNCRISKVQCGIYSQGTSAAMKNQDTKIENNELNAVAPENIGVSGIKVGFENNIRVSSNKIANVASGSTVTGINLGVSSVSAYTPTGNEVTNAVVSNNEVGPVINTGTGTAIGIAVCAASSGISTFTNNTVSSVKSNSTAGNFCAGIYLGGGAGSNSRVYFNSVSLTDAVTRTTPGAYAIVIGGNDPVIDLTNNIFSNTQTTSGTGNSYAIGYASSAFTNLIADHNLYYTAGSHAQLAVTGGIGNNAAGTIRADLAALRSATARDVNSKSVAVNFASATDLHLTGTSNGDFNLIATPIAGLTTDMDGDIRNTRYPYMGADEASIPLPVKMLTLTAVKTENNVLVSWTTASETNNSGFDVERSVDGKSYTKVGFVKGAGNSNRLNGYNLEDAQAFIIANSNVLYYRLKQLDVDGNFSYTNAVVVTDASNPVQAEPLIYPNPFKSEVQVKLYSNRAETATITITDISGKVILSQENSLKEGDQIIGLTGAEILNSGIYLVRISQGEQVIVRKLVKD